MDFCNSMAFLGLRKCLLCLISGRAGKMDPGTDTKSLQLSKQDENMLLKKKQDYPCKWKHRWGNLRSEFIKVWLQAAEWKLEWQHANIFQLVSAWNGTRKQDGRCSQQHLFFNDTDCICPGLPGCENTVHVLCQKCLQPLYISNNHFQKTKL